MWFSFRVAEVIGCSVEELEERITHEEYMRWIAYLKKKDEHFEKWEWYAAQIAWVVARTSGNRSAKLSDFTIKGNKPKKVKPANLLHMLATAFGTEVKKHGS